MTDEYAHAVHGGMPAPLPNAGRGFRFGLRSVFAVLTVVAVGIGLYAANARRVAAAQRRYDAMSAKLRSLVSAPAPGFVESSTFAHSREAGGMHNTRRYGREHWRVTWSIPASKASAPATTLLKDVKNYFRDNLAKSGMRQFSDVGVPGERLVLSFQDRESWREFSVGVDARIDGARAQIELSVLWLFDQELGFW